ncbi:Methylthioribose-1-phosphate isomerase [uncultured Desulfobacterium sp.]|uniref:Methylthioribose-1-phosphate isomerase n=1 Tax=uncultured Desulfobacterium sp. TaxID=201089 RepID=A0A445N3G9_9BACT|nr:Methylthioribose-1-phosphate isomerase [uncultured Desulfobacterium sp.]
MIPTIEWSGQIVRMIDQRKLPAKVDWFICRGYRDVISGIKDMVIRGAPAIGVAAAMGLALGARSIRTASYGVFKDRFRRMADEMLIARPTAVNLRWAIDRMTGIVDSMEGLPVDDIKSAIRKESEAVLAEDIEINRKMGKNGLTLIPKGATILTHCNAGSLATGGYGTALGVIRAAHENGKKIKVIADETRPWLQGLRLTAFELMQDGIDVSVIADNAAGSLMRQKRIELVITGADRIAANGDVANKIGTYQVAVLAKENKIPFYVAAPISTIDPATKNGDMIPVEERAPEEICRIGGKMMGPSGVSAINPVFDITPARYVSAIITEQGVIRPPFQKGIKKVLAGSTLP